MAGMAVGQVKNEPGNPNAMQRRQQDMKSELPTLPTFIYDYLLKRKAYSVARAMLENPEIRSEINVGKKQKDGINGDDFKDLDAHDLPPAQMKDLNTPNSTFLDDWWSIFWDLFNASRQRPPNNTAVSTYFNHSQQQQKQRHQQNQQMLNQNQMMNAGVMRPGMNLPNGMNDVRRAAIAGSQQRNPMMRMGPGPGQPPMGPQQMQRDGSQIDMSGAGSDRPQSPMSGAGGGDNAPSPKRPRIDGSFNGAGMNPQQQARVASMGGQMNGVVGGVGAVGGVGVGPNGAPNMMQNSFDGSNPMGAAGQFAQMGGMPAQTQMFRQQQAQQQQNQQQRPGMAGPNGMQGSPMVGPDGQVMSADFMGPGGQMRQNVPNTQNPTQNGGALADYQMQLMLLEQQNKKRLLMARQEQDASQTNGAAVMGGPQGMMNQPQFPGGNFAGPNGQLNPQQTAQLEMARQQSGGRPGNFPPGAPGMPQMMAGPGQPQPPNAQGQGPQGPDRGQMPPPQAPAAGNNQQRGSPAQQPAANPPTPSQTNKPNPKQTKKKDTKEGKKAAGKKGAPTPSSEADPPTPTPQTPITPQHPNSFNAGKGGPGAGATSAPAAPDMSQGDPQAQGQPFNVIGNPSMDGPGADEMNFGDFGFNLDGQDVLEGFDFNSFLHIDDENMANFDPSQFGNVNGDGVEMGAGQP